MEVEMQSARDQEAQSIWVFGYGSLCWNPGFHYKRSLIGHVKGFVRRFWQGNTTHRGTDDKPGRVATLIEDGHGVTWGRAFEIDGDAALPYLEQRECKLGGYVIEQVSFHPVGTHPPITTLVYIALPDNKLWLGEATLESIARQVTTTAGVTGHNAEYILRLARFMREHIPSARDDHLFALDKVVRNYATALKMCLVKLGGDPEPQNQPHSTMQFASTIKKKELRCMKM